MADSSGTRRRRKKWLLVIGALLGVLIILVAAVPLWFPWMLKPIAARYGATFGSYDRAGFTKLVLHDVRLRSAGVDGRAERMTIPVPTAWLWWRYVSAFPANEPVVDVTGWQATIHAKQSTSEGPSKGSLPDVWQNVERLVTKVRPWAPRLRASSGRVIWKDETLDVPAITWNGNALAIEASSGRLKQEAALTVNLPSAGERGANFTVMPWDFEVRVGIAPGRDSLNLTGSARWQTNQAQFTAAFDTSGWLPTSAQVRADNLAVAGALAGVPEYERLNGSFVLAWNGREYVVNGTAHGAPRSSSPDLPPLDAVLRLRGDLEKVLIEQARVSAPWLTAGVSENVVFDYSGQLQSERARVNVDVDLMRQPWLRLGGKARASVDLMRGTNRFPQADFVLSVADLIGYGVEAKAVDLEGKLRWPHLELVRGKLQLENDTTVNVAGTSDIEQRHVSNLRVEVVGDLPPNLVPGGYIVRGVDLKVVADGPITNLVHSGSLKIGEVSAVDPLPLSAQIDWGGTNLSLGRFELAVARTNTTLRMSGEAAFAESSARAVLRQLELRAGDTNTVSALQPIKLEAVKEAPDALGRSRWLMRWDRLELGGAGGTLQSEGEVLWPDRGVVTLAARGLNASLIQPFIGSRVPDLRINRFEVGAGWTNGPATLAVYLDAAGPIEPSLTGGAVLQLLANADGTRVEHLGVSAGDTPVITGSGMIPVRFVPGRTNGVVDISTNSPIDFALSTQPSPALWERVATMTGVEFREPHLDLAIKGTITEPSGHIRAKVAALHVSRLKEASPRIDQLIANVELRRNSIVLHQFEANVEGQHCSLTGRIPLGDDYSQPVKELVDWRNADLHVRILDASVAPIAKYYPDIFSPQGEMNLDVRLKPGGQLEGELALSGATTRPIMPFGPVQDISARLKFSGRQIGVDAFRATLGGAPLAVSGTIDVSDEALSTGAPVFRLRVQGASVPLSRQPELILRSDLDVTAVRTNTGPAIVSGNVQLRDSFFLSDLEPLIPGRVASPARRPPYFSIEAEPLASWKLDLRVRGDGFLTARTPLFRGQVSANFQLVGTLREPMALGEARIESGAVQFPFANLRVEQGLITMTSDDPFRPQVFITAASRTFGYDVKMEVTGPADRVLVEFSATPTLTSEEIVLMLTAGEVPKSEYSASRQQRASRLAMFLGRSIFSKLGGGEGKGGERLTIRSGENISERGRPTYYIEYKLTDKWSLVGEYDRFSELNAGVKWRFYSR